jgi:hypothetical protein
LPLFILYNTLIVKYLVLKIVLKNKLTHLKHELVLFFTELVWLADKPVQLGTPSVRFETKQVHLAGKLVRLAGELVWFGTASVQFRTPAVRWGTATVHSSSELVLF